MEEIYHIKSINHIKCISTQELLVNKNTREDFSEWYFICASFKHDSLEDESLTNYPQFRTNQMFWLNHIDPTNNGAVVRDSDYGNKAKVEIISRTDLLRARGFKV